MKKFIRSFMMVAVLSLLPVFSAKAEELKVCDGIYIDDNDISGMTEQEVNDVFDQSLQSKLDQTIHLICVDGNEVQVPASEFGIKIANRGIIRDIMAIGKSGNIVTRYKTQKDYERENLKLATELDCDRAAVRQVLEGNCLQYDNHAKNYVLKRENEVFSVINGEKGTVLDLEAASSTVYNFLTEEWDGLEATVNLPVVEEDPMGSPEELAAVTELLGTFSTSCKTSSAARVANIANGCRLINGITLYPGEEYSTLDVITPFTEANGYHMAGSYLNGLVVDSLGGGICQVSTTLYNAVLRAELEVTGRSNHSMCVAYVPLAADAAIAESAGKDFRFRNNMDYPVYIEGYVTQEKVITFNI